MKDLLIGKNLVKSTTYICTYFVISLVKPLLSRNFCQKSVRVNYSTQCGNYRNLLSRFFGKKFVKATLIWRDKNLVRVNFSFFHSVPAVVWKMLRFSLANTFLVKISLNSKRWKFGNSYIRVAWVKRRIFPKFSPRIVESNIERAVGNSSNRSSGSNKKIFPHKFVKYSEQIRKK